jgi:uncharacterized protein YcgI (DUF1989 family)
MTWIDVPSREGRGVRVTAGQRFRVIDVEGGQVADTFAFRADDVSEFHSAEHTRVHVNRLFPVPGEQFVTNNRRPILLLEEDRTPATPSATPASASRAGTPPAARTSSGRWRNWGSTTSRYRSRSTSS